MAGKYSDFDKLLLCSIDETLFSLGPSAQKSIYFHLKKAYNLTKNDIPSDLGCFQMALEHIFGVGARYLEIMVMKNLYLKIGQPLALSGSGELEFLRYIDAARDAFLQSS